MSKLLDSTHHNVLLNGFFSLLEKNKIGISSVLIYRKSLIYHRTSCRPIRSVIILVIKQIGQLRFC